MHATKGGWVGQTFALANCNASGGGKSRIRRSKEERKTMAESFIKKYQSSNNGNFPSLNLTHKEVGGSFYTVREIVREIIQENRVLGPAKFTQEEQNADRFLESYPLGSISIEPQIHLVSSNGTYIVANHDQDTSEEKVLNCSGQCPETLQQRFCNEKIVNGSVQAGKRHEKSDEPAYTELQGEKSFEEDKNVAKELEVCKTKMTTDVVVETFPLRPVSKTIYGLDGNSDEPRHLIRTVVEKEIEHRELEAGINQSVLEGMNSLENSSGLVDEKADANLSGPLSEQNCVLVDEKADPSFESLNFSTTKESIVIAANDGTDLEIKDSLPAEDKPTNTSNGIHTENLNSTNTSSSNGQSEIGTKNKPDIHHGGSSEKGSIPSLDRINLESWDATSKKTAGLETNPLLALFKAFIAAFVKLLSD